MFVNGFNKETIFINLMFQNEEDIKIYLFDITLGLYSNTTIQIRTRSFQPNTFLIYCEQLRTFIEELKGYSKDL